MSVDLKYKYREETNKDVCSDDNVHGCSGGSYSGQYVKWLEKQVKNNDLLHNIIDCIDLEPDFIKALNELVDTQRKPTKKRF